MRTFIFCKNGKIIGPFTRSEVGEIRDEITSTTPCWTRGEPAWRPALAFGFFRPVPVPQVLPWRLCRPPKKMEPERRSLAIPTMVLGAAVIIALVVFFA